MTREALADLAETTATTIYRLERGQRKFTDEWKARLAPHLHCSVQDFIADDQPMVPIVGHVEPGGAVTILPHFLHLFEPAIAEVSKSRYRTMGAADMQTKKIMVLSGSQGHVRESLEVQGDSSDRYYRDGDIIYTDSSKRETTLKNLIGQECLVKLESGEMLIVAEVLNSNFGKHNLMLYNATTRRDVKIEWAVPIRGKYRPPK